MNPTTAEPAATPLSAAVDAVDAAVEDLIKAVEADAFTGQGAFSLVELLQRIETVRNKLPSVDRAIIQYGTEQGVPNVLSCRTMRQVLMGRLRLSAGEANRRVKAAGQLADRHSMLGEPLPPLRPHLAAAQRAGLVTAEQVSLIDTALGKVKHCDPDKVEAGEIFLVEHAGKLGYQDLDRAAAKLVEAIDPDGILPSDEAEHRLRRFFHLKQRRDGSWAGDFRLTPEVGQKLAALLGPLMKPNTTTINPDDTDGDSGKKHVEPDERTQGQRRHDALEDIIDRTLNSGDLPASGGTPTTLIITMSWQDFTTVRGGTGSYADGTPVSAQTARRLADQAEVAFCVKSDKGAVLDMHRTRRIATPTQTLALIARDGGCSFPGCEVAPQWCERHHVIGWYEGGPTNLGNLTLVCGFHHRHFAKRGWQCQINTDGLPVWIPPRWIDPQQRPIMNHRIIISNWDPNQPLDLNLPLDFDEPDEPDPDPPDPPDPSPDQPASSS
jgi:hypothetical protein